MIRLLLLLLVTAAPANADTARVLSGEHGEFTRLVIELPSAYPWRLGRTENGYAFSPEAEALPDYDVAAVWQRIDQTRLLSVDVDSQTGALVLSLACDCHIFPFEYQPGVIVLDIKPGPAPSASAFEAAFAASTSPVPAVTGADGGYDWRSATVSTEPAPTERDLAVPLATGSVSLEPLRDELLRQIAGGAAEGVVDMRLPGKPAPPLTAVAEALPWANIRIGDVPGVVAVGPGDIASGGRPMPECPADGVLDLGGWNEAMPPHELLAEARAGLYGEFDAADPKAVMRSVRLLLYLGFGAEADQTASLLDGNQTVGPLAEDVGLYRSMARLIDGESDPQTPFAAMLHCDGPAALWAALARDRLPKGPEVNRDAILQAFIALPSHLRQVLGPGLAERFLAQDDADAARMIRDAVERAPDADEGSVALLDATANLDAGDTEAAKSNASKALALDGDDPASMIALVDAHFQDLEPIAPTVAEALMAIEGETHGSDIGDRVARALVLALALSDQTGAAFRQDAATGPVLADLWRVASTRATDDDFLRHAVLPMGTDRPEVAAEVAVGVAERLLSLGFPDAAMGWIEPVTLADSPDLRILAATAKLGSGDATAALELLDGLPASDAGPVRAEAMVQLGRLADAGQALSGSGNADQATRLAIWEEDWARLDPQAHKPWVEAAIHAVPRSAEVEAGLLLQSGRRAEDGLAARMAVVALLSAVPSPSEN